MRKLLALLAAILLTGPGITRVGAAEVTVDLFYRGLEPHGDWIETADYGYVWHPRDVAQDWRPYTVGSWAYTDAGWTWVSEEPFGWATYHYGRWVRVEPTGWVWVPDTEWAPAWVSWRRSPKYVGWAPLPPEARFQKTVGIKEWADSYYDIGPEYYSFVETRHFGAPRLTTVVLPPRENVTVIRESRNITNITVVNNYVHNGGPEYDVIVRESSEPVRRLRLERRTDIAFEPGSFREETIRTQVSGDTLRIAAPDVRFVPTAAPARVTRRVERVQVDRGWNVPGGDRRQAEQLRAEIRKEAPQPPAQLPRQPRYERLAERAATEAPADRTQPGQSGATAAGESRTAQPGTPARGQAGAPAGTTPPGATVGTPGSEEGTPAGRPGRGERAGRKQGGAQAGATTPTGTPATTEPGATPSTTEPGATPGATATTPTDEKAPGRGKGRDQKKARTDREQATTPGAATPTATPGTTAPSGGTPAPEASTSNPATTTPSSADETTGKGKGADRGKKKGRADREQPGATTPGTTPDATTGAPSASTPATTEESAGKGKGADRDKKKGRTDRAQPADTATSGATSPSATASETAPDKTPSAAPADSQKRKGRGGRGEESSATARPEAPDRSPATAAPSERSSTSPERRSPTEASGRPEKSERPERPDRSERGGGRPEAAAPDRGDAGGRAAERPGQQPQNRTSDAGGGERPGRAERPEAKGRPEAGAGGAAAEGGRERGGRRSGGAGGPGGTPEAAGAPGR